MGSHRRPSLGLINDGTDASLEVVVTLTLMISETALLNSKLWQVFDGQLKYTKNMKLTRETRSAFNSNIWSGRNYHYCRNI